MLAPQTAEARGNNTIGRLDEDGPEDSLGGSQFLSESIQLLTDQVARRPRTTSPHASRLDVSFSLTGAYSRKPGSSQHRRAGSASFGSAISTRGPVRPAVGAPDPSLSSIFLKTEPPSSVGTQPSFYRSAARAHFGLGTRDEAQKVYPAFAPGVLASAPEVGPGKYRPPDSVGKQADSSRRTFGSLVFGSADRFASNATLTPGPVYTPKYESKSTALNPVIVKFGTDTRLKETRHVSPPPKYNTAGRIGTFAPAHRIGKMLRPENLTGGERTDVMYNVVGKYNGFQRNPPASSFPKSKRF